MLLRGSSTFPAILIGPLVLLGLIWGSFFYRSSLTFLPGVLNTQSEDLATSEGSGLGLQDEVPITSDHDHDHHDYSDSPSQGGLDSTIPSVSIPDHESPPESSVEGYREVFSVSTPDKKYFKIIFGEEAAINPNIIPHPSLNDTWIIVAQRHDPLAAEHVFFAEWVCNAVFRPDGSLSCLKSPVFLPIGATFSDKCVGEFAWFSLSIGPHDGRVFYGPDIPYTMYGSQSTNNCFGQWIQDFRYLVEWDTFKRKDFTKPTDIERPQPYGFVEKNFFVFWDIDGQIYTHYDITPKRIFAQLNPDGSAGKDIGPNVAATDAKCIDKYVPKIPPTLESIHQATNSLSITMCKRTDAHCIPTRENTFIFSIFHHKTFYSWHGVYEPIVMLFQQFKPFSLYAISDKPIWISGRGGPGEGKPANGMAKENLESWNQTEMMYVTSVSWKQQGMKYHGYLDDIMFLAFGIEDEATGGIDVLAADLVADLGLCLEL